MPRVWPGTSPHVLCPSPSEPCCAVLCCAVGGCCSSTAGHSWDAVGCPSGAVGELAASGSFSCLCWFAEPFNRPASFSGLTAVGSNAFGGLGNPTVSEYRGHDPPCSAAQQMHWGDCLLSFFTGWFHHLPLRDGNLESDLFQSSVKRFLLIT